MQIGLFVFIGVSMSKNTAKNVVLSFLNKQGKEYYEKKAMDFSSIAPALEPGKPLNDRELIRTIRLALAAEEDAAHLYELIADSTKNNDVKKVLQDIANEEKVHSSELRTLIKKLDSDEIKFMDEGEKEVNDLLK